MKSSRFVRSIANRASKPSSLRRECGALITLTVFLQGQYVLPLSAVWAQSSPPRRATPSTGSAKTASKKVVGQTSVEATEKPKELEFSVTLSPVDTSKVPSQAELMAAGGLTGPLAPLGNADIKTYKGILAKRFSLSSVAAFDQAAAEAEALHKATGLGADLPILEAKQKVKRLENINVSFGRAINQRNARKFAETAESMREHIEKYPDSPWVGEAMLHLSLDALSNGRPAEAQARLQTLMDNTVEDPEDPTWEVRCKTKATWANLDLTYGQWDTALPELQEIIRTDENSHRRMWALAWLAQARQLSSIRTANLRACGSEALGAMLASVDADATKRIQGLTPPNPAGFTLEEMARIAKRYGVQVRGFKVTGAKPAYGKQSSSRKPFGRIEQLSCLPLPLIIHFDMARYGGQAKTTFGIRPRGAAWTSQGDKKTTLAATRAERQIAAARPHCEMCLPKADLAKKALNTAPAKPVRQTSRSAVSKLSFRPHAVGHYLLVRRIDSVKRQIRLEDPTARTGYTISFEQLEKEWSGSGLTFSPAKFVPDTDLRQATNKNRLIWLAKSEMSTIRGGCCCAFDPPGGPGRPGGPPGTNPPSPGPDPGPCPPFGSPVMQVNPITNNLYIEDVPIWYTPAIGPSVQMKLAYNSQDTTMYSTFGANWRLNFASSLVENPGGQVIITGADGASSSYVLNAAATGYVSEVGNHSVLSKTGASHFELTTPTGDKVVYDKPVNNGGSVINLPLIVLNEVKDRFGYSVKVRYETYTKTIGSGGYTATLARITRIVDAQSKITTLSYNSNGYCTRISDPFGRQARFEYNASGQMTKVEDMGGDSFAYAYDSNNLITTLTTAQGVWEVKFQFPSPGYNQTIDYYEYFDFITKITPPGQPAEYYRLDTPGFIYTDANGHQTLYKTGDAINNRPVYTAVRQPDGSETSYTYDHSSGQANSITNAMGETLSFFYNALGNLTRVVDPNGHVNTLVYYPNGVDLKEAYNTRGNKIMSATYTSQHMVATSTVYPTSSATPAYTTSYTYKAWGAPATLVDPKNQTTTFNYDVASSRLSSVQRSATGFAPRTIAAFSCDAIGRIQNVTNAFGVTRTVSYNDLDKPIKVTYGDGSQEITDYVCCRLPGVTIDRSNRKTYYDYDEGKRLRRVQDSNGNTTQMDYDAKGNMVSFLDAKGAITRWDYDVNDRAIRKTFADGSREGYAYDAAGRLSRVYDSRGQITKYEYDPAGKLTKIDYPSSPDETFVYDDLDHLQSATDSVGITQWSYDLLGRTTGEDGPWSNDTVSYGYDGLSEQTSTDVNGSYATGFTYDPLGRLTDVTSPASSGTVNPGWHWDYDATKVGSSAAPSQFTQPNATITKYNWQSPLARLKDVKHYKSDGTTMLSQFVFGFDDVNKRDARMSQGRQMRGADNILGAYQTINYGYDTVDQLLSETSSETVPEVKNSFVLDPTGNRSSWKSEGAGLAGTVATNVRSTGGNNRLNQTTSVTTLATDNSSSTLNQSFDSRGNLSRSENTLSDRYALYYFDDANRLEKVLWQKRANQTVPYQNIAQSIFYYDAMSRRRRVLEQSWNAGTSTWTTVSDTRLVYNGTEVVQERDSATNTVRVNLTRIGSMNGILGRQSYTSAGVLDKTSFYIYDGNGNVVQTTDALQNVQSAYWYDAFGNSQKVSENTGYSQPYRYSTKWLHGGTGMYDYGSRFYNASLGKWINRDPSGEVGGTNLYAMVGNSPTNSVDVSGLVGVGLIGGVGGAAGIGSTGAAGVASATIGPFFDPSTFTGTIGSTLTAGGFANIPGHVSSGSGRAVGIGAGAGLGAYFTTAPNAAALKGAGGELDIMVGFGDLFSVSVSVSGPYFTVAVTDGGGAGLAGSITKTDTNAVDIPLFKNPFAPGGPLGPGSPLRNPFGPGGPLYPLNPTNPNNPLNPNNPRSPLSPGPGGSSPWNPFPDLGGPGGPGGPGGVGGPGGMGPGGRGPGGRGPGGRGPGGRGPC